MVHCGWERQRRDRIFSGHTIRVIYFTLELLEKRFFRGEGEKRRCSGGGLNWLRFEKGVRKIVGLLFSYVESGFFFLLHINI